jgi:hypothetical protein
MKVVRISALRTSRFYPQETFLVLISVRVYVDPSATVRPDGISQWKIPVKHRKPKRRSSGLWRSASINFVILIKYTIRKEISYFCATEISITVFTGSANSLCVMVDMCMSNLHVYLFEININTIVSSTNINFKCCLRFRHSRENLCVYLLPVMRATTPSHLVINMTKSVVTYHLHWVIASRTFFWKILVVSSKSRIVFVILSFWKWDRYFLSKRL